MIKPQVVCFGEVLWDVFPDKKVIGGAPLNVALRLQSFGTAVKVLSAVGNDAMGIEALDCLKKSGLSTTDILIHEDYPTGQVLVSLDDGGSASYEISQPVAWDAIPLTEHLINIVKETPYFIFGSLAVRGAINRNTLAGLLDNAKFSIFDVNLRAPHFKSSMVYELMQQANMVKLNDEELDLLCNELGGPKSSEREQIKWLSNVTQTDTICLTRGGAGALLYVKHEFYEHSGYVVEVSDTVGAGDSFLATLVDGFFLKKLQPLSALDRACAVGALVASKSGANAKVSEEEIQQL